MTSTVNYTYGNSNWGDQLTNFNGATITYDAIGNPISMGGYTYEWEGRTLLSRYDDYEFANYTYNSEGLRISKEYGEYDYNGYRHEYTLNGSQIVKEVVYYDDDGSGTYVESYMLVYIYDENGSPIGMKYRTPSMAADTYTYFFFEKNLQGDIVSVYNSAGVKVIAYTYDAWGNCTTSYPNGNSGITGATYNPFRYRGYYYDIETGFYYLQSRYYNPQWGRFLNADKYLNANGNIIGFNLFAYCSNNPITFVDQTGESILFALLVGAGIGAIAGGIYGGTVAYNSAKSSGLEGSDLFWETAGGVAKGALIGSVAGGLVGATCGVLNTYGPNSIVGTAMITVTATVTARALEVAALQAKKSLNDGDDSWQVANDCLDAVFCNGGKIILPIFTKAGTTIATYFATDMIKHRVVPLDFNTFLSSVGGKALPYLLAGSAWVYTVYAIFCDDPVAIANQRGYVLK